MTKRPIKCSNCPNKFIPDPGSNNTLCGVCLHDLVLSQEIKKKFPPKPKRPRVKFVSIFEDRRILDRNGSATNPKRFSFKEYQNQVQRSKERNL